MQAFRSRIIPSRTNRAAQHGSYSGGYNIGHRFEVKFRNIRSLYRHDYPAERYKLHDCGEDVVE